MALAPAPGKRPGPLPPDEPPTALDPVARGGITAAPAAEAAKARWASYRPRALPDLEQTCDRVMLVRTPGWSTPPVRARAEGVLTQHGRTARFHEANQPGPYETFQGIDADLLCDLTPGLTVVTVLSPRRRV